MRITRAVKWTARAAVAVVAMAVSAPAFAQGCAMCYNSAAAAKASAIQALRSGVLILLFPVLLMFIGIFVMAFRSRNRFNEPEPADRPAAPGSENQRAGLLRAPERWRLPGFGDERSVRDWQPKRPAP